MTLRLSFEERLRGFVRDEAGHELPFELEVRHRGAAALEAEARCAWFGTIALSGRALLARRPLALRYELARGADWSIALAREHLWPDPYAALTTLSGRLLRAGRVAGALALRLDARDDLGWMLRRVRLSTPPRAPS